MRKTIKVIIAFTAIALITIFGVSAYVTASTSSDISLVYRGGEIDAGDAKEIAAFDPQCILVLGCAVWDRMGEDIALCRV